MERLSPATRKIVAVGLLVLVLLLGLTLVVEPLFAAMGDSLSDLRDARFRRARLEMLQARPLPPRGDPVAPELLVHARSAAEAAQTLAALIGAAAARSGATLGPTVPLDTPGRAPRRIAVAVSANGTELAIDAFASEVEHGTPLLRLTRWTLTAPAKPGDPAHLDATVSAVWGGA